MKSYIGSSDKVVLIMTGIGGSENGYDDKYVKIAENVNNKYKASVFIFATPPESWGKGDERVNCAITEVNEKLLECGITEYELYCMGISAGGAFLGAYAYRYARIKKLLLVNPVIQINYNHLLNGLENTTSDITIVFGELDPSYKYSFMLDSVKRENVKIITVPTADHRFSGKENIDLFIKLPETFFEVT